MYTDEQILNELETIGAQPLEESDFTDDYNDMLDAIYSFESVGGVFSGKVPSAVLEKLDPIAYACGLSAYVDDLIRDCMYYEIDDSYYCADDYGTAIENLDNRG